MLEDPPVHRCICHPQELDFLHSMEIDGRVSAQIDLQSEDRVLTFTASGQDVNMFGRRFDESFLSGSLNSGQWVVDQLQLDELSIAAE